MPHRLRAHAARALLVAALALTLTAAASLFSTVQTTKTARAAAVFSVNSTADGADADLSDNACDDGSGNCTLRAAIQQANATSGPDRINFNLGAGARTIAPAAELPDITDPVVIDATTQPGFAGTPVVELSGANRQNTTRALLVVAAGGSTVRGLVINRSSGFGLALADFGHTGDSSNNRVEGNYVGTNVAGDAALPNAAGGIDITSPSNEIGGSGPGMRNVISGNGGDGIHFGPRPSGSFTAERNRIVGNYIGTNAAGDAALANRGTGVGGAPRVSVIDCVISGNTGDGVVLAGLSGVHGSFVGTDATGTRAIPNGGHGVRINGPLNGLTPFGPRGRNVISGNNGFGIFMQAGNRAPIQSNLVGTDLTGTRPLPNGAGGVRVTGFGSGVNDNLIAYNRGPGILFAGGENSNASRNSVFANGGLGIDLDGDGVTPNDFDDADAGPNSLQNFPVITAVTTDGATTTIRGAVNGTPGREIALEFYTSAGCDPSGHGEGARFFGETTVRTDAGGDAAFLVTLPAPLPPGRVMTATAHQSFGGGTSEFSPCHGDAATGLVQFGETTPAGQEPTGLGTAAVVPVFRVGGSAGTVTVNYQTRGGTASPSVNYVETSGTLTFGPGETFKSFSVPLLRDGGASFLPLTFFATLDSPGTPDALGHRFETEVLVYDRGQNPFFIVSNASVTEGDDGTTDAVFTIRLPFPPNQAQTPSVQYSTVDMTAVAGLDYQHTAGTADFRSGTTQTVRVPVFGDRLDEPDKTFGLQLSNPSGAFIISNQPAQGHILDDDRPPSVSVFDAGVAEPAGGTVGGVFNIRLSAPSANTVTVNFETSDGTAAAGSDYQPTGGTFSFDPGLTSATVVVPVNGDTADEPVENFFLRLSAPTNATLADPLAVGTIGEPGESVVQFGPSDPAANEGAHFFDVTVTRTGDASGAASVNYATLDETATERADYTTAAGTVRFAAGETSKIVRVLLTEDAFAEGAEELRLALADAEGARLGARSAAVQVFADSPPPAAGNPIDDARVFVRQHYHDLLGREPDAAGLDFWSNQIIACAGDAPCVERRRVAVSSAFFLSIEFRNTGYQVIRVYKASFPHTAARPRGLPRYRELLRATREIGEGVVVGVGDWEQRLGDNTRAFARRWVSSADFLAEFPATMTAAAFVDKLFRNAQVVPTAGERDAALAAFGAGGAEGRAAALLDVTGSGSVFSKQFNAAFVLMQYVGYLRRGPDDEPDADFAGYDFWLTKLNSFSRPGADLRDESAALERVGQAEMIRAFINSAEYRQRFGR